MTDRVVDDGRAFPSTLRRHPAMTVAVVTVVAVVALVASGFALPATAPAYPTGDHAVLELYTLYATESPWPLGPYSRFAWHHPGPLFFYWELPWHLASGQRTLGMQAGALALAVVSLGAMLALLVRFTPAMVSLSAVLAFGVYTLRLHALSTDFWNPLVVVLPMTLLVVLGAGLACRRWRQMPWFVFVASFLVQTHVSVVPCVVAVTTLSLLMAWRDRHADEAHAEALRSSTLAITALVLAAAWALPIFDTLLHWPGNLGNLATFFLEPATPVPWSMAVASWSGLVSAVLRPGLVIPGGDAHVAAPAALPVFLAVLQVVWLMGVVWGARRTHQRMLAALGVLGVAVVLVALVSITRVHGPVGDYLTFWLSAVAVLNWSVAAGGTIAIVTRSQATVVGPALSVARAAAVAVVALVAGDGVRSLAGAEHDHRAPTAMSAPQVRDLTDAVEARIRSDGAAHPRFHIEGGVWPESAGVVLQLRKRGVPVTVDGDVAFVFSAPPTSQDDAFFVFTDDAGAAALGPSALTVARAGRVVVAAQPH